MKLAFITNTLKRSSITLLKRMEESHNVTIFLPESEKMQFYDCYQIRLFSSASPPNMFQRYDLVICHSDDGWDCIVPIMKRIYCVVVINEGETITPTATERSAYTLYNDDKVAEKISRIPSHLHWFEREVATILNRLEKMCLLNESVKGKFESFYGIPLIKDWLLKENF